MSLKTSALWLALFTLIAWSLVAVEAWWHHVDLMSLGAALTFTATLVALPFVSGLRVGAGGVRHVRLCHQCGANAMLGIPFCIHCGSFPRAAPRHA